VKLDNKAFFGGSLINVLFIGFLILIPSLGFGGWPIFAQFAKASPAWTNLLLMTITAVAMNIWYLPRAAAEGIPPNRTLWIMLGVALLNSVALVAFGVLIQRYPGFVPIAQALMPMVSLIGGVLLLGSEWTMGQLCFGIGACVCIAGMGYCTPK
jgi:magnesium-transporting ATPase (P-type)